MNENKTSRELQADWELAIERATESDERPLPVEEPKLKDAAGLRLQTRVRAGQGSQPFGTTYCPTYVHC